MAKMATRLEGILKRLEKFYGKQKPVGPRHAYEMVIYRNAGYPQSDERCAKGFEALKKEIGLRPEETFVAVPLILLTIALAAACIPACRASRVDPMIALRYE